MIGPEIGQFALALALMVAVVQGSLSLIGAHRGDRSWMAVARPATLCHFGLVAVAFGCLTYAFVTNDFSVVYVVDHSNSALPLQYRVAAVWGGHEGSLLLWLLMLSLWMLAVSLFTRRLPQEMTARVLGVMSLISVGFIAFVLFTSNPFERLIPAALNGHDLNPLLQDPAMVLHPPVLYMGYVGLSVAYAFAMAALLSGRLDAAWARWSRPWTILAWVFLTLGIALGSLWAYYELGWGGWWFWDPVENASFMPWLVATALIHSLAVTEKRGSFRSWTVFLAILAFALSLLGTFLVRSGVLTSVHAFAADPQRGMFILTLLTVVIGASLVLYAWRTSRIGFGDGFAVVSRESLLLTNNVLLAAAAGSVLLGTLYPLALDALGLGKISVGPPYFDAVFVPLIAPALFLMGVGPLARWKKASIPELAGRLRWTFAASLATALLLPLALGGWSPLVSFGLLLAVWIAATSVMTLRDRVRYAAGGTDVWLRLITTPRACYGMLLAHLGIAAFVAGVTLVKAYEVEKVMRMRRGDAVELAGYTFRLDRVGKVNGPNYRAARATIEVTRDGRPITILQPQKRIYAVQQIPMTEAAIDSGFARDLYVSLGDPVGDGRWLVRVHVKPFVSWIWAGCLMMALGGLLAASDRRYRAAARSEQRSAPTLMAQSQRIQTAELS